MVVVNCQSQGYARARDIYFPCKSLCNICQPQNISIYTSAVTFIFFHLLFPQTFLYYIFFSLIIYPSLFYFIYLTSVVVTQHQDSLG